MNLLRAIAFLIGLSSAAWAAEPPTACYSAEQIPGPEGVTPECNAIAFLPDGRLVAAFDHGEVYFYTPSTRVWKKFAEGLHTPMGVLPISDREILVMQRAELTRLVDSTGSGVADRYDCVCDAWGISGNYHEFAYGPVRDRAGNLYIALGAASRGGVARYEVRGRFREAVPAFGSRAMFSSVPYRGWVAKITPDGRFIPIACGFRQPDGIVLDPRGRLFVTDNQGDWVGTSKLHEVVPGGFYGQPAGLVWRPDWNGPPSLSELDRMHREGVILFSHAILANSPGQPLFDLTGGKFGPYAGQMFVTEFNIPRVLRVMLEDVAGQTQGAAEPFFDGAPLRAGNIRLAFAPDGSLWVSETERKLGWPAGEGLARIAWTGRLPFDVREMHLTRNGFEFRFTKAVDPASIRPASFTGRRYYYLYHAEYGSPRVDVHELSVASAAVEGDGTRVRVALDRLEPGYIYEFHLDGVRALDGAAMLNPLIGYTANRLLDGSAAPSPRPPPTGDSTGSGKDKMPNQTVDD